MYAEKMATSIKVAGKVLRESGDTVALPFGSEYSLFFKNLNSVRALVKVEIDGVDVTGGTQLIVPANGSLDLERFIENGNFESGHRFKFIERTAKIEEHRGIGTEDGLIRIEFEFERLPSQIINGPIYGGPYYGYPYYGYPNDYYWKRHLSDPWYEKILCSTNVGSTADHLTRSDATLGNVTYSSNSASLSDASGVTGQAFLNQVSSVEKAIGQAQNLNDAGITVHGSESQQKFQAGAWFATDGVKHVMVMKLIGKVGEQAVEKPVTVKTKKQCPTCGTSNKSGAKFCKECGTGLSIV